MILSGVALALAGASCQGGNGDDAGVAEGADAVLAGEITVFAAASLSDAFAELGAAMENEGDATSIEFSFASSSALRVQIEEGAPADVFASADLVQMELAVDAGIVEAPAVFARNELVIVVPDGNPAGTESVEDLADAGLRVVLANEDVPIGRYAREVVGSLAGGLGTGFEEAVLANVVSNESDARAVLAKVELGEADAGIVYITDALVAGEAVEVIEIPDGVNVAAEYPIGVVSDADNPGGASGFIDFVLSDDGQAILREHGFTSG